MRQKKKDYMLSFLAIIIVIFLNACGGANTTGIAKKTDVKNIINITQHKGNKGDVNISPDMQYLSEQGDIGQDTKNNSSVDPHTSAALSDAAGLANAAMGQASNAVKDATMRVKHQSSVDNSKNEHSSNVPASQETSSTESATEGRVIETYETRFKENNPKPFTWLNAPGQVGEIIFSLDGCENFIVPDGSRTYSVGGYHEGANVATYFYGMETKEGREMGGRSSVFMHPGCATGTLTVTYK